MNLHKSILKSIQSFFINKNHPKLVDFLADKAFRERSYSHVKDALLAVNLELCDQKLRTDENLQKREDLIRLRNFLRDL